MLSQAVKDKLRYFKNTYLDGYATKSYSQEGEDLILNRIFEYQQEGFYIDVGAHHPKRFSNTYFFYKKGWMGINIDAMPGSMKLFNKFRPRDINIEKLISDKAQTLTYYAFNELALNGFSKEISEERDGEGNYFIKFTKDIQTLTLAEVLNKNLSEHQKIDFLSLDVEGLDFIVLKSHDFKRYRPKVILIEILKNNLTDVFDNEILKFLYVKDYLVYAKSVNTVFFICKNFYKERYA
ncbi:SAM-dependent methyltransferase [Francisella endosymbiont of Amblyomma maculatum]|nr:SAM-dependent methyltransferase [Francisella endosymbiont of Amblyomma maculatum]